MGSLRHGFKRIESLLFQMKDIVWIEIGVYKGETAEYVLRNFDVQRIYLIDPYTPLPYFKRYFGTAEIVDASKREAHARLREHEDRTVFLEDFSENVCDEIPDGSCSVLFIDGNHHYESVLADLNNFVPKVKSGGLIIGDDLDEPGVEEAIAEYVKAQGISYEVENVKGRTSKFFFRVAAENHKEE